MIKIFKINKNLEDQRLDKYLKRQFSSLTQSFIQKNLRKKNILVNNKTSKANYIIKIDDQIKITNFSKKNFQNFENIKPKIHINKILKQNFKQSILHENENFLVIDKWFGIATQGGTNITMSIDTIIKSISKNYNLVHRLDKETTGLLIIAKNLKYTRLFGQLFKSQKLNKTYLALCNGKPKMKESLVDLLINSKDKKNTIKTKTYYKVLAHNKKISLIQFEPKTGKKHQLRIVAKNLGCPIVGDLKYNLNKSEQNENLKLNSFKLEFIIGNDKYNFNSKLSKDFIDFLNLKKIKFNFKSI